MDHSSLLPFPIVEIITYDANKNLDHVLNFTFNLKKKERAFCEGKFSQQPTNQKTLTHHVIQQEGAHQYHQCE
jgi:hypothetical protein